MLISFVVKPALYDCNLKPFQQYDCQYDRRIKSGCKSLASGWLKKIFLLKHLVYNINYFTFVSN